MVANKHTAKIIIAVMAAAVALCFLAIVFSRQLSNLFGGTGVKMEYESKLFDTDEIISINIEMDENSWNQMLSNAMAEEYYVCNVVINGKRINNVAIRPKGNTSLSAIAMDANSDRFSFKLEFDHYVKGQTCFGLDKLILNNNYADATYMKETVVYDMYQYLGADASLYNYSKISVNGEYIGVYIALEGVEDSFMLRNYGTKNGELYKPENMDFGDGPSDKRKDPPGKMPEGKFPDRGGFGRGNGEGGPAGGFPGGGPGGFGSSGGSNLEYTDDDLDSYSTIWDGEVTSTSKKDHKRVVEALKAISEGDLSTIEEYMDVDNLLKYMAVHEFAVNEDSLSGSMAHNYYLYESNGQLNIIPWDYNLSWGGMGNADRGDPRSGENLFAPRGSIDEVDSDSRASSSDATSMINDAIDDSWQSTSFFDILLENEEYNARYHEYLQMLVDYVENGEYEKVTSRIHSQIDELVETDPTAFYTYDEYTAAYTMLDEVIALRAKSIQGQLDGTIPSTSEGQKEDSEALIDGSGIDTSVMGRMNGGGGPK